MKFHKRLIQIWHPAYSKDRLITKLQDSPFPSPTRTCDWRLVLWKVMSAEKLPCLWGPQIPSLYYGVERQVSGHGNLSVRMCCLGHQVSLVAWNNERIPWCLGWQRQMRTGHAHSKRYACVAELNYRDISRGWVFAKKSTRCRLVLCWFIVLKLL